MRNGCLVKQTGDHACDIRHVGYGIVNGYFIRHMRTVAFSPELLRCLNTLANVIPLGLLLTSITLYRTALWNSSSGPA